MKKEDVLKQAQSERNEEYENAVIGKSQNYSIIAVSVICVLIFFIRTFVSDLRGLEKVIPSYDIFAIMFANLTVSQIYIYRKLHENKYIVIALGALIIFILSFIKFITTI